MTLKVAKIAALGLTVAAGTIALAELPLAARASAASPALPIVEARLPEAIAPRLEVAPGLRPAPAKPAGACADQAWPYISPDCATRDDGRPIRQVRVVTSANAAMVSNPVVATAAPEIPAPRTATETSPRQAAKAKPRPASVASAR